MTEGGATRIVIDDHVAEIEVDVSNAPKTVEVTASLNGARRWESTEPGWRDLAYGVSDGDLYWWSARHLVALPAGAAEATIEATTDEDILVAFRLAANEWLVVCETSVLLIAEAREQSRLELSEVITEARREASQLQVRDAAGGSTTISIIEGRLVA